MNAGPLDISWAKNNPRVVAILECFFPAQAAGEAIRRVLFNDGPYANPAGRLPATWPMSIDQVSLLLHHFILYQVIYNIYIYTYIYIHISIYIYIYIF